MSSLRSVRPKAAIRLMANLSLVFCCRSLKICMAVSHSPSSLSSAPRKWQRKSSSNGSTRSNSPVVLLYDCFVSVVQPVAFTLHDVVHGLGIELVIIDSDVCLDRTGHFDADETATSRRVGQQVFQIAGPDEGGIAAHFLNSGTVGLSQVGNRFLQEVLQEALLIGVYLVEFVDVNQKKRPRLRSASCLLLKSILSV